MFSMLSPKCWLSRPWRGVLYSNSPMFSPRLDLGLMPTPMFLVLGTLPSKSEDSAVLFTDPLEIGMWSGHCAPLRWASQNGAA